MIVEGVDELVVAVGGGRTLAVRSTGSGPPVLLLHGIPGSAREWDDVVAQLAERHTVFAPHLLGFGGSARPRHGDDLLAPAQASAIATLLDELAPTGAVVVGHDFGGPVALELLRLRPQLVAALGLCATNAFPDTPIPFPIVAVTWPLVGGVVERMLFSPMALRLMLRQGWGDAPLPLDETTYLGDAAQQRAIRTIFATSLRELRGRYEPLANALRSVAVPTLVAWGDRDPFFGLAQGRRTAAAAPNARFVRYPGCGHFVPAERPTQLAADISRLVTDSRLGTPGRAVFG